LRCQNVDGKNGKKMKKVKKLQKRRFSGQCGHIGIESEIMKDFKLFAWGFRAEDRQSKILCTAPQPLSERSE
jgi:hypothetical protein